MIYWVYGEQVEVTHWSHLVPSVAGSPLIRWVRSRRPVPFPAEGYGPLPLVDGEVES
jgi:hypothetical protein